MINFSENPWDRILYELDIRERLRWAPHNFMHALSVFLPRTWGDWLHDRTQPTHLDSYTDPHILLDRLSGWRWRIIARRRSIDSGRAFDEGIGPMTQPVSVERHIQYVRDPLSPSDRAQLHDACEEAIATRDQPADLSDIVRAELLVSQLLQRGDGPRS